MSAQQSASRISQVHPDATTPDQAVLSTGAAADPVAVKATASEPFQVPRAAKRWSIRIGALVIAVAFWHLLTEYNFNYIMNFANVPDPAAVFIAFLEHIQTSEFYIHIVVSIKRILIGYGFAVVIGIVIGLLMGRSKLAEDFFISYIEVLRPIPAVAWIPMAILMWPTEESSIIFITFLGALFPIVLNTALGAEQTPAVLVRAARSLGASNMEIFWHVVIPSSLPSIAAGLSIGMGVSWFSLLAGEIISGQYGIGYFTWAAYSLIEYDNIVVGMLVIGGLGTLSTYLVRLATKPFLRWQALEKH
ncbi:MAG: ABC transporter permease [Alphaproteobacteria bacterium]